jgi:prevent-host-death family protein
MTTEIKASEFKAKCLQLLDEVQSTGDEIIITKHGRPVGKLTAYRPRPQSPFGLHQGRIRARDDLTAPTGESWDAEAQ